MKITLRRKSWTEESVSRFGTASPARLLLLLLAGTLAVGVPLFAPPLSQDPAYHEFADQRVFLGIPNALNVLTNAPFAIVGALGFLALTRGARAQSSGLRPACYTLFAAVFLVAFGSAFYHLNPNNSTLIWDRLPMAVGFMSLLALLLGDRVNRHAGELLFLPLVCAGIASVEYWRLADDLRFYLAVQYGGLLLIAIITLLFPPGRIATGYIVLILAWYGCAKVLESLDTRVYGWGGLISGHSLKHLAAAMATTWMFRALISSQIDLKGFCKGFFSVSEGRQVGIPSKVDL